MTTAAACAGAVGAVLLLPARSRWPLLAGLVLMAAASAGLAVAFARELGGGDISAAPAPALVGAGLVGLAALAAFAAVLVRFPAAVVPLLLLTAPLRPPLDPDTDAALLVSLRPDGLVGYHLPLYAVLAAATLALVWRLLRGEPVRTLPLRLAYPAAALVALAAISLLWSFDQEAGINEVMLFWLPYAVLMVVVANAPLPPWMPRTLAWILVGLGCVFGLVGLGQVIAGEIFFSTPALAQANATTELFRVTSLFQDPSIFGRDLVVAMAVVLVALWTTRLRLSTGIAVLSLLGAALFFTYSQSSLVALAVVALAIAAGAGGRRTRLAVTTLVAVVAMVGLAVAGLLLAGGSAAELTRNRSALVLDTAVVFTNHPVAGVGIGGQPVATRDEADTGVSVGQSTSHTTPLTIAAELGLLGLAAYVALLAGIVLVLRDLHRRDPPLALGLAAILLVLFVHALTYEGFFETALTWGAMAFAGAALRRRPPQDETPRAAPARPVGAGAT